MLMLGMIFCAELVLAIGPFDDPVALVVHPNLLALPELDTGLAVIFATLLQVVESAGIAFLDGVLVGGKPPAAIGPALGAIAPAASAAPAASLAAILVLGLLAVLFLPLWLPFGGAGLPGTPPGLPVGLDLGRQQEGGLLSPVLSVLVDDIVHEIPHEGSLSEAL